MTFSSPLLVGMFGTTEILLILFVIILLFGAKRIPELAKGLGKGIREFKDASKDDKPEFHDRSVNPNDPNNTRL
jgi:sec-independent protein translocase protein TatA